MLDDSLYKLARRRSSISGQLASLQEGSATIYLRDQEEKIKSKIDELRQARARSEEVDVLFFPFSRILDPLTLRIALLLFDHIWLLDSTNNSLAPIEYGLQNRAGYYPSTTLHQNWLALRDDYDALFRKGIVKCAPTEIISEDFSQIIGEQFRRDVVDMNFRKTVDWKGIWTLPANEFPWKSTYESVQVLPPVKAGKLDDYLAGTHIMSDGSSDVRGSFNEKPPQIDAVLLNSYQGASLKTTQALIFSAIEELPVFSNQGELVNLLIGRSQSQEGISLPIGKAASLNARFGVEMLFQTIDPKSLLKVRISDIISFREKYQKERTRYWTRIRELTWEMSERLSKPGSLEEYVNSKIKPELVKLSDELAAINSNLIGGAIKKLSGSALAGLMGSTMTQLLLGTGSTYALLGLAAGGSAAVATGILPGLVDGVLGKQRLGKSAWAFVQKVSSL